MINGVWSGEEAFIIIITVRIGTVQMVFSMLVFSLSLSSVLSHFTLLCMLAISSPNSTMYKLSFVSLFPFFTFFENVNSFLLLLLLSMAVVWWFGVFLGFYLLNYLPQTLCLTPAGAIDQFILSHLAMCMWSCWMFLCFLFCFASVFGCRSTIVSEKPNEEIVYHKIMYLIWQTNSNRKTEEYIHIDFPFVCLFSHFDWKSKQMRLVPWFDCSFFD